MSHIVLFLGLVFLRDLIFYSLHRWISRCCIECNISCLSRRKPLVSLLRCTVKQPLLSVLLCFLLSTPPPFSLTLVAGLFLLSPAMMTPHLAVGTMRNDKMGEPCFYLMGQNQTTVCSQKSVPIHSPPAVLCSFPVLIHPSRPAHPDLNTLCLCLARGCVYIVCMLCVLPE